MEDQAHVQNEASVGEAAAENKVFSASAIPAEELARMTDDIVAALKTV